MSSAEKDTTCARCGKPADPPVAAQLPDGEVKLCVACSKLYFTDRETFWDGFRAKG